MKRASRAAILMASVLACEAALQPPADHDDAKKALAVLERTKTTKVTYALYSWNKITPVDQAASEEWSAEFNDESSHRVETPRDRLIANCVEMSGFYNSLTSGKTLSGPAVAGAVCGINTDKPVISIRYMGHVVDPAGDASV
ncbi:hypothetical protein [Sphingomonas oryzagri]